MITCTFEDGGEGHLRHVTVNTIIYNDKQEILLGKRGSHDGKKILEHGKWGLIGGFVDRDENLIEASQREIIEETGIKVESIQLFRINDSPNRPHEDRQNIEFIFTAQFASQKEMQDEEILELRWFSSNNLPEKQTVAFDHYDSLDLYHRHLNNNFQLPIYNLNSPHVVG